MKLNLAKNSLFAILLRSRWWVSLLLAAATTITAGLILPKDYAPLALFSALPFIVIGSVAAWQQWGLPSPERVEATRNAVRAMTWTAFADVLESGFRAQGYAVVRLAGPAADFELTRAGRVTLVSGRRWKAARTGIEPLRELQRAMVAAGAASGIYVSIGEPSDAALAYARESGMEILQAEGLATLLRRAALPS